MRHAVSNRDDATTSRAVDECLLWGAGYRKDASLYRSNVEWLSQKFTDNKGISDHLASTSRILLSDSFNLASLPPNFRMNSGLTKVYALLNPAQFMIYDSRVAAGIGCLVALYKSKVNTGWSSTDSEHLGIRFLNQGKPPRNPNQILDTGMLSFYPSSKYSNLYHAQSNVCANWLIAAALKQANKTNHGLSLDNQTG